MRARPRIGSIWAALLVLGGSPLCAATGVPAWEKTFRRDLPGSGEQFVLAARELADGTTMTVVQDNGGITSLRYDHSGGQQSSSTVYPVYPAAKVAVDPFGGVFVASVAQAGYGSEADVWFMKYDGLTGKAAWPAGVIFGSGNGHDDDVLAVLVDPAGDLVAETTDSYSSEVTLLKYGGRSGENLWGPSSVVQHQGSGAPAALDASGNVYIAYETGFGILSVHLAKYAASSGAVVWRRDEAGHDLHPVSLEVDGAGNVVLTGNPSTFAGGFEASKYAGGTGQQIWGPARYDPPAGNYGTAPDAAAVGADGSVVIFGHTSNNSVASAVLLKFRGADGGLDWGPLVNTDSTENFSAARLSLAGNGDAILSARFQTGQSSGDVKTWRYDGATGSIVWGPEVLIDAIPPVCFVASNGRVFAAASVFNGTDSDAEILERDGSTGVPAWGPTTFAGDSAGYAHFWDLTASPDGNVVVTGTVGAPDGSGSWATLKYDRVTGAVLWGPVFFASENFGYSPWQVLTDASGDVLVAGYVSVVGATLVKYSGATGVQLWASAGVAGMNVLGLALDPAGNGFMTGYTFGGTGYDAATVKISGATGATLWGPVIYDSGSDDFPDRIGADAAGDVVVVGHSGGSAPPGFVLKYAGSSGALSWSPVTQAGLPSWVAVDAAGDIFLESYDVGITTTKYSGANGAVLWGPLTAGAVGSGYGTALALDAAGDAFVTGSLYTSSATGFDYALIKYRGSDGAVLWGPVTYDGGRSDYPYGVVLDGSGNAAVTGSSDAGSNERRTATLSYDGPTGALRWGPVGQSIAREGVNGLAAAGSTVYVGSTRRDVGFLISALTEELGIATLSEELTAASCGQALDRALAARNGIPPYSWSVVSGSLPPGVSLDSDGHLSGAPSQEGVFSFRVRLQDSAMAAATRDFSLAVGPAGPLAPVLAETDDLCQVTLSVSGSYAQYQWLPGGASTPFIVVAPTETTTYGVVLDDGSSCAVRGAITIRPADPSCLSPGVLSISPASGPSSGIAVVVTGSKFQPGAVLSVGGLPAIGTLFGGATDLTATTPALAPGTVNDVLVVNPDQRYGLLLRGFATDFLDVANSNPFSSDIIRVLRAGITAGCGGGNYCPGDAVSRAQMAVFLLKAEHGFFHVPSPCVGVFSDVACPGAFAADWIEQLSAEGITAGCGGGNFCPGGVVSRAQMSAFLLKAEHGSSYVPPPCIGVFGDVPCGSPFADWIEQLFHENVTAGCGGGNYCPSGPNTRAQMAVFLAKTFGLP